MKNQFKIQTKMIVEEKAVIMIQEMVSCYPCPSIAKSVDWCSLKFGFLKKSEWYLCIHTISPKIFFFWKNHLSEDTYHQSLPFPFFLPSNTQKNCLQLHRLKELLYVGGAPMKQPTIFSSADQDDILSRISLVPSRLGTSSFLRIYGRLIHCKQH